MDLRHAEIEAPEVVITAFAFWGGIKIIVPEGFDVELEGFSFMGGRASRCATCPLVPGLAPDPDPGFAVMGGIEVRSRPNRSSRQTGRSPCSKECRAWSDALPDRHSGSATIDFGRARRRHPPAQIRSSSRCRPAPP